MRLKKTRPNVILLTGAGASGYCGLATLGDLLTKASIGLQDAEIAALLIDVRRAIEARRPTSAIFEELIAKLREYKSIISTLRLDPNLGTRAGGLPSEIATGSLEHKLWKALTVCYRALINEYGPNNISDSSAEVNTIVNLLSKLAGLNGGRLHLFTTNYDCSYQVLAGSFNTLDFLTHIDNSSGEFSDNQWFSSRKDLQRKKLAKIYVHRLHGCVAWFNDDQTPYRIFEVFGAGRNLEIKDDDLLQRMCIKLVSSEEIGLNAAFLTAFKEFIDYLAMARCLLVWGFSFRDQEVVRTINNTFYSRRDTLPVYFINPFLSEENVMDNIRRTLRPVPVKVSEQLNPRQVKWRPHQSGDELVRATLEALKEVSIDDS